MGTCETKAIHSDLGILMCILAKSSIFQHIQTQSGSFRNYSGILRHIQNSVQPWYVKNPCIYKTRGIFTTPSKM